MTTSTRTFADARRWMAEGSELFLDAVTGLGESGFGADSGLPGWTRKHLAAHVAGNAEALGHLVHWAATGVETPMYSSPEERAHSIERGATLPAAALDSWLRHSAEILAEAMDRLTAEQWRHPVVTAQGRTVPATEIPWLRAREVNVHAVDLATGITFADLSSDFCEALVTDIVAKRGMTTLPPEVVDAPLAEVTAWLAGRPHSLSAAPMLGPWI
ncbi:maleylpyruvate isomerase family mycothiol-dependent enzyme [Acrocarpospora pleiomorpha]|nr:maleylpyruvate isomerase family mycothiol-dependent enzyme [Acrocarpospora pleiomorpha]